MPRGEVLVAIINNPLDMRLAREEGWYRIPVTSVHRWLRDRWPPRLLAFYQTKVFGPEAHAINYCAAVHSTRIVSRLDLFPDTPPNHPKANRRYYQLLLGDLQPLPVMTTINRLGGLDHTTEVPVRYDPTDPLGPQQLSLFDQED